MSTQPTEQPAPAPPPTLTPDPPDSTPGPTPISVSVDWQVVNQWDTGYQASIRLLNNANAALSWNLQFDLSGSLQSWWDVNLTSSLQWIQTLMAYMGGSSSWTYWSLNPNSGDTGGILQDDWVSVQQWKLDLLTPYQARQFVPEP